MSSSPPNSSDDRRRHLGRRFEDQRRREELDRDQALREQRERAMAPIQERIRDSTSRLFPQTAAAHDGASGAPEPPDQRAASRSPQDPRPGEEGDSGKIAVQAEEYLDGETSGSDDGDGDADGAAVADVKMQLAEQERVCETLREAIGQKDREIKALKDERDAAELAKATAGLDEIAEWRDKHERTVEVLSKVQRERRELEGRLEESESRERVLKKQLEEAKEAKRDVEEKLRHEENRTARRSEQVERNPQGMEGELNGLRARAGAAAGGDTHFTVQVMNSPPLMQAGGGERRDSLMSAVEPAPSSAPPTPSRSTRTGRGSSSTKIVPEIDSKGEKRLAVHRKRKNSNKEVFLKGLGKMVLS